MSTYYINANDNTDDGEAISSSYGTDTITLDPSTYGVDLSLPTVNTTGFGSLYSTTIPNGGYSISTGAGSYNWTTGTSINQVNPTVNIDKDGLTMKEGADIVVGGKSLTKAIEQIEERLGILHPNPELEDRWNQLKELRRQYIEMEQDLLEKEKIMKILKES